MVADYSTLFRYRSTHDINLPLKVIPTIVEHGKSKVEYTVSLRTNFNIKLSATEVALRIPTPLNATQIEVKVTQGKAKYVPGENVILWKYVGPLILSSFLVGELTRLHQDPSHARRLRSYSDRLCRADSHDKPTSVGKASDRR